MRVAILAGVCLMVTGLAPTSMAQSAEPSAVTLEGFSDAIHHWQNRYGDRYERYDPSQVSEIADNILLRQRDNGGWIENRDPMRVLSDAEKAEYQAEKSLVRGSFDNRNVYPQVEYLMGAYEQTGDEVYRDAALRGLDYLLTHQVEGCGGWPHTVPTSERYHPLITIADEVTSGSLNLLRKISEKKWPFESLSEDVRERTRTALEHGDDCVLRLQVRQGDQLAGWAGQYDPETLEPAMGRTFELPAIAVQETVEMLRYLMSIETPSEAQVRAIEGGVDWLKEVAIKGTRLEKFDLPEPVEFRYHTARQDRRLVADPDAPLLWGRFYDVNDNTVVLANRDSVRVETYQEIAQERRTGYDWYGSWANDLLTQDYPAWQCRVLSKAC